MPAIAYLITFNTYGSWLHGDDRGSVRAGIGYEPPNAPLLEHRRAHLVGTVVTLCAVSRRAVLVAIVDTCAFRHWQLDAAHVRTQHVHAVVRGGDPPEKMASAWKANATRVLRERGLVGADARVWARHASTRWLWDEEQRAAAAEYVYARQGEIMARYP